MNKVKFQALWWACNFCYIKYALDQAFHCALTNCVEQSASNYQLLQYSRNLPHSEQTSISYVYWTVHHCDSWRIKTNLMSHAILFHFLCAQHVSDINISIIRSLRLFCWITTLVVLFLVLCVLFMLQPATRIPLQPNHTETPTHIERRTIRPMW